MAVTAFRPRSASELVDAAFQLLRRDYLKYITLVGIAYIPWLGLLAAVSGSLLVPDADVAPRTIATAIAALLLFAVLYYGLIKAALLFAASDAHLGGHVDVGSAIQRALPRFWPVLGASILKGFIIFFGMFAIMMLAAFLVVAGIGSVPVTVLAVCSGLAVALHFVARFAAVPATVAIETNGAIAGLARSSVLTAGERWHVLKALALVWIIFGVISMIGSVTAIALPAAPLIGQLVSAVIAILAYPLIPITETLLYYDLRIRKEGYDIELMAREIGRPAVEQPAV